MGKRILLATSAAPNQSPFSTAEKRPPLGIGFIISVLRNAGHHVDFVDYYLNSSAALIGSQKFVEKNYDFVGIYANTVCFRSTLNFLHQLNYLRHSGRWQGKIIVGGPHTTVAPESIPAFVDYIVQGEGEDAVLDIVEGRLADRIIRYPRIQDLDRLPMPAWDVFIRLPYDWSCQWFDVRPVFTMNTSRGCPFRCAFCSVASIWGRKYTFFSAKRIVSEMEYLIRQYGAKGFYFREDNFTINRNRVIEFCELLIKKKIDIPWVCETRVNSLDRELVKLMARAGAKGFYFGVESGSQRILDFLKKDITVEQIRKAFSLCHEFNIKTAASLVVGVPTETEDDLEKTRDLIREINPTLIWENVFVGIPNSDLYRYTIDNDLFEFIDDRGLVYLKGHDHRVKRYYGNSSAACMPVKVEAGKVQCPDISVIMSVYNGAKYLKEAVHSILQQTHQNLEFVIVDDGSTDDTWSVLTSLKDPRIVLEKNANNVGLAASLNKAVRVAKGRYVARMDSDDISLPHRLEKQFAFLEDHPECGAVGSSFYEIDENGKIVGITRVPTESSEIRALLREQNCIGHGTVMMRKDVLLTCGGYDERFKYAQDYDLWLRMSEKYEMANIEEPLYCWRSTDSCISNSRVAEQKMYANMALSEARQRLQKPLELRQITAMPIVSVVIPTFNRPDRLQQSIRSVLNQTYQNVEIIVVNDGGTPSENIVCQLAPGAIYVRHDKNRGLAAARNTAIKLARGKYIAYLDDDDRFLPQHLETSVTFLEKNGVSVVYTDAYRVHEIPRRGQYVEVKRDVPYSFDFSEDRILVENFIPVLCVVHERRCLDEVGLFDETLPCLEDWDLWIRMSRLFKFHHLKHITAEFTWREDGSSMTSSRQLEFIECRNVIYRKYRNYSASKPHVMSAQLNLLRRTFNDIQRAMNSK